MEFFVKLQSDSEVRISHLTRRMSGNMDFCVQVTTDNKSIVLVLLEASFGNLMRPG